MCDGRIHARLQPEQPDFRRNGLWIAAHNIRATMRKNRAAHAFLAAPLKLSANRGMSDRTLATLAQNPASDGRAVADVEK
jgi:hypothetical protein